MRGRFYGTYDAVIPRADTQDLRRYEVRYTTWHDEFVQHKGREPYFDEMYEGFLEAIEIGEVGDE